MLSSYYAIKSRESLKDYLQVYTPLALSVAKTLGININTTDFAVDHVGLQATSSEEFDEVDKMLCAYAYPVHKGVIHNRRNNLYQFEKSIEVEDFVIGYIETFEPKPDANVKKLKAGIEHISFVPTVFDRFYSDCLAKSVPIDKLVIDGSSKFFKTVLVNMIELEFRSESLVELLVDKNIR